jgi:phage shock protein A
MDEAFNPEPDAYLYVAADDYDALAAELVARNATTLDLTKHCNSLRARIRELEAALRGVIRVANRKTDEFDAAHAALNRGDEHGG